MSARKTLSMPLWLAITILSCLASLSGCIMSGAKPARPSVVIVASDRSVQLVEPNEPYVFKRPGVVLSRGHYLYLIDIEMQVRAGNLMPRSR